MRGVESENGILFVAPPDSPHLVDGTFEDVHTRELGGPHRAENAVEALFVALDRSPDFGSDRARRQLLDLVAERVAIVFPGLGQDGEVDALLRPEARSTKHVVAG